MVVVAKDSLMNSGSHLVVPPMLTMPVVITEVSVACPPTLLALPLVVTTLQALAPLQEMRRMITPNPSLLAESRMARHRTTSVAATHRAAQDPFQTGRKASQSRS